MSRKMVVNKKLLRAISGLAAAAVVIGVGLHAINSYAAVTVELDRLVTTIQTSTNPKTIEGSFEDITAWMHAQCITQPQNNGLCKGNANAGQPDNPAENRVRLGELRGYIVNKLTANPAIGFSAEFRRKLELFRDHFNPPAAQNNDVDRDQIKQGFEAYEKAIAAPVKVYNTFDMSEAELKAAFKNFSIKLDESTSGQPKLILSGLFRQECENHLPTIQLKTDACGQAGQTGIQVTDDKGFRACMDKPENQVTDLACIDPQTGADRCKSLADLPRGTLDVDGTQSVNQFVVFINSRTSGASCSKALTDGTTTIQYITDATKTAEAIRLTTDAKKTKYQELVDKIGTCKTPSELDTLKSQLQKYKTDGTLGLPADEVQRHLDQIEANRKKVLKDRVNSCDLADIETVVDELRAWASSHSNDPKEVLAVASDIRRLAIRLKNTMKTEELRRAQTILERARSLSGLTEAKRREFENDLLNLRQAIAVSLAGSEDPTAFTDAANEYLNELDGKIAEDCSVAGSRKCLIAKSLKFREIQRLNIAKQEAAQQKVWANQYGQGVEDLHLGTSYAMNPALGNPALANPALANPAMMGGVNPMMGAFSGMPGASGPYINPLISQYVYGPGSVGGPGVMGGFGGMGAFGGMGPFGGGLASAGLMGALPGAYNPMMGQFSGGMLGVPGGMPGLNPMMGQFGGGMYGGFTNYSPVLTGNINPYLAPRPYF